MVYHHIRFLHGDLDWCTLFYSAFNSFAITPISALIDLPGYDPSPCDMYDHDCIKCLHLDTMCYGSCMTFVCMIQSTINPERILVVVVCPFRFEHIMEPTNRHNLVSNYCTKKPAEECVGTLVAMVHIVHGRFDSSGDGFWFRPIPFLFNFVPLDWFDSIDSEWMGVD